MATMWKRAMLYLGLGPDEEYDDDDGDDDPRRARSAPVEAPEHGGGAVRPISRDRQPSAEPATAAVATPAGAARRPGVVRPLAPATGPSRPFAVAPASFNDAQQVADRFLANTPVIMNLEGVERDLARRLVDFASGLCYGTRGQMEKVTTSVYLLTPSNVEVSAEDRRKLQHGGG